MDTKGGGGLLQYLKEYLKKVQYSVSHMLQTVPLIMSLSAKLSREFHRIRDLLLPGILSSFFLCS